jgi:hypothetical protein
MLPLNKPTTSGDNNFANPPLSALSDQHALEYMRKWMIDDLPCIAGRRETIKNRYMVEIATRDSVPDLFNT